MKVSVNKNKLKTMPKVSILVPIYNVEKYLRQCLDSIVKQTLQDIEIICINDGSTDSSLNIIEEFADKDERITIINKKNSGYGASMNMGLEAATGEYIGIIESDDFAKETMFEDLYALAKEYDCDVVKSDYYSYFTEGCKTEKAKIISLEYAHKVTTTQEHPSILRIKPTIWSAIYKSDFLKENDIKFLETPGASYQDTSFAFKTSALAKKMYLTTESYVSYRQDNENSSVNSKGKVYMVCAEWEEITKFLNSRPKLKEILNSTKLIKEFNTYLWNLERIDRKFWKEFIDEFAKIFKRYYDAGELDKTFYKKHSEKRILMLINNRNDFYNYIEKYIEKKMRRENRRKYFSVHIKPNEVNVRLFGKNLLGKYFLIL